MKQKETSVDRYQTDTMAQVNRPESKSKNKREVVLYLGKGNADLKAELTCMNFFILQKVKGVSNMLFSTLRPHGDVFSCIFWNSAASSLQVLAPKLGSEHQIIPTLSAYRHDA